MDSSTPKHAHVWRIALAVIAVGLSAYLLSLVGPPPSAQILAMFSDSIAVREGAMPPDAHVFTEVAFDWSAFPAHLLATGDWHTCDRPELVIGYYEVDLISGRVVSSGSESWSDTPEAVVSWTDLVSVDATGHATFSGAISAVETDTSGSLPRLTVLLDGDAAREIVVTVPWDTAVVSVSGEPLDCHEFVASLKLPTAVAMEVQRTGGEPWTTRIELQQ